MLDDDAARARVRSDERLLRKIVERPGGPRAVSLTDAGEVLLRHAEAIVARLDAARADIAALRAGETGALRVGTYQSVGARVLPEVMRRFLKDWPGIELGLSEPSTDPELYGLIESGELDLAFCSPPLPDGPFDMLELMSDPYVLLVPAESLAGHAPLLRIGDDDDLKGATLLFASQAGKHITGQVLPIDGGVSAIIAA